MGARVVAVVHEEDGNYGISFPDFPGCVSAGATLDAAVERGRATLAFHVEGMVEDGDALPRMHSFVRACARERTSVVLVFQHGKIRQITIQICKRSGVCRRYRTAIQLPPEEPWQLSFQFSNFTERELRYFNANSPAPRGQEVKLFKRARPNEMMIAVRRKYSDCRRHSSAVVIFDGADRPKLHGC